jgi:hypothetical protein
VETERDAAGDDGLEAMRGQPTISAPITPLNGTDTLSPFVVLK